MILESGTLIFLGLALLFWKLELETCLKLVGKPLALDVCTSVIAYILHYGTFSGMMAAAVAGLMTSAFTSCYRKCFGYILKGKYTPGLWDVRHRLGARYAQKA